MAERSQGMQQARRQTTFRVLVVVAFLWGCFTFLAGVSWLRSALEWTRDNRVVEWQQYSMSALLLSFAVLVVLGTRWPRLGSRLFLLMFGLTILQAVCITQSTGDGVGAAIIGCIALLGIPSLLVAALLAWRSRWDRTKPRLTIAVR